MGFSGGGSGTSAINVPVGAILPFGGAGAPSGYLLCDGQAVSRTTFANLFAVIGTQYGVGDGSTTFNVPDFRTGERFARGALNDGARGTTGGLSTVTLTGNESGIQAHAHNYTTFGNTSNGQGSSPNNIQGVNNGNVTTTTGPTAAIDAHENKPPFVDVNWIVKA